MRLPAEKRLAAPEFEILDRWVIDAVDSRHRDSLLDLRSACLASNFHPMRAVRSFLKLRPVLRRLSYLSQHRLRRWFERMLEIEVVTPTSIQHRPLNLDWVDLDRILSEPRREVFEQGVADWNAIRVRLVIKED